MFDQLIKIALNAALENPEIMKIKDFQDAKNLRFLCIKERLRIGMKIKVSLLNQENIQNKVIDIDKNSYKVME